MQVMNIKDYDVFDFHIYGSKGKILISGIGRDIYQYKIENSKEHSGFKELNPKYEKLCKSFLLEIIFIVENFIRD